ncbi:MAG: aldolase [Burkholderiaceae bacterium]|nr:aldolase [Burkholderiaceae bacterium]
MKAAATESGLRDAICELGRSIYARGLTHGSTGNISVRLDDGFLATPTGSKLGALDPAGLAKLGSDGAHLSGDAPTKETFLHLAMYGARARAGAVVHLHSTYSTAVSVLENVDPRDVLPPLTAYYVMRIGSLPLVPYHPPGDSSLADAVRGYAGRHHALLLANHGPVVAGSSLSAAADAIEELEATARLHLALHGRACRCLTPAQVAALKAKFPIDC